MYPENDGCHPLGARCDRESQLCICLMNNDNNFHDDELKKKHFEHKHFNVFRCLPRRKLKQSCQHSAQCYSMTLGSGCFRLHPDSTNHWQCSCVFGFKNDNKQECVTEYGDSDDDSGKQVENLKQKCEQTEGYLWVPVLQKCVASRIHYSMRVGRAGGGRGGGHGGSVGRSTGSRSWFNNHRRNYASLGFGQPLSMMFMIIIMTFIWTFIY